MDDIQIIKQLLNGQHLEKSELKRGVFLIAMLRNNLKNRGAYDD